MADLQNVFAVYTNGDPTMDGKSFVKLAKDTKLLDGRLTATDVDLIFAKVKNKAERRITYMQFLDGLDLFAQKKGVDAQAVQAKVAQSKGPILSGTVAEANKFHDDKSLYTGVHSKGGPSTIDTDKVHDISQIMDRSDADVRGVSVNYQSGAARTPSGNVIRATSSSGRAQTGSMRQSQEGTTLPRMDSLRRSGSGRDVMRADSSRKLQMARPGTTGSSKNLMENMGSSRNLARAPSSKTMVSQPSGNLGQVFMNFTNGAPEMDGRQFAKFAKDTGVVNKKVTPTDIDLIFAKVKGNPAARKISFQQFVDGLEHCASKRGTQYDDLEQLILKSGGPTFSGTVAEANKFHDDKSLYTGVYANGGPSTIDNDRVHDISQIMDRSDADVRGVSVNYQQGAARTNSGTVSKAATSSLRASTGSSRNLMAGSSPDRAPSGGLARTGSTRGLTRTPSVRASTSGGVRRTPSGRELVQSGSGRDLLRSSSGRRLQVNNEARPATTSMKGVQRAGSGRTLVSGPASSLKEVFNNFCGVEAEMDGRQFAKFAKDCGVVNRQCTATDIDLIFAKIKDGPSARRIGYQQFLLGVELCAQRRGDAVEELQKAILAAGGPAFSGTVAEANKFHDDKSLYTGTHGGSMLVSRTESRKNLRDSMEMTRTADGAVVTDSLKKKVFGNELKQVFADYCDKDEATMDGKYFAKLAKDCQLVGPGLTETDLDLTFAKIKEKDARRITYLQFLDGLAIFAQKKGASLEDIKAAVGQSQGPILYGTVAEANKFHDDKSLYTGTHAGAMLVKRTESRKKLTHDAARAPDGQEVTAELLRSEFGNDLKQVFTDYCDRDEQNTMDNKYFTKLAKDCELLDHSLLERDCDIAFMKVKNKDARRITYTQFLEGLVVLASKKGVDLATIKKSVAASQGPILYGTVAEQNRFHDDKSLYTGMHAGGDGNAFKSESRRNLREGMEKTRLPSGDEVSEAGLRKVFGNDLKDVFQEYCDQQGTMDGKYFNKLAKDCEMLDSRLKERDVDLAFAKIKERDARRITYLQFLEGLVIFANKKGVSVEEVKARVSASEGPVLRGTFAEANKFHDDKSLYTGMHSDKGSLRERTEARKSTAMNATLTPDGEEVTPALLKQVFGNQLRQAFVDYCDKEDSMDNKYFAKLAKDCELIGGGLKEQDVDLTFAKVKDRDARRVTYAQFLEGLVVLATKKGISLEEVRERVASSQGPILTGTVAEKNKFHDDKSLYTGVHAYGGPTTLDTDKVTDLGRHLDRSPADVRGVKNYG